MGAPRSPMPRKPTPASRAEMASRKDFYPFHKVKYLQLYDKKGTLDGKPINKWHYRMPDGRTLASGRISREDYAYLVAQRIKGELPAECLATFRPKPDPPTWRNAAWWKRKWWSLYGKWRRGEFPKLGRCDCGRFRVLHYTPSMRMDDTEPRYYCLECGEIYTAMMEEQWADYYSGCM